MRESLQVAVAAQAERRPDAVAVSLGEERLTYGELEAESNRLARLLKAGGLRRGDRVCLLVPRSPPAVVAILAVLKADAAYVPLDVTSPASRVMKMIDACGNRWILAADPAAKVLDELFRDPSFAGAHSVGWLSAESPLGCRFTPVFRWGDLAAFPATWCESENGPGDPAHILFTSGSTGVPKGVVITHGNVLAFLRWAHEYFATSPTDRISWHPPLHFDLATFTNLYGPTETTIASSYYTVPRCPQDERAEIPIGRACSGEELLVMDERLQPVPSGVVGDLYIGGVGLSPGYWNDDAKTRSVFVAKPSVTSHQRMYRTGDLAKIGADGLVYFVGRADSQIKSRGYRIELGEIEAALHSLSGLRECAVVGLASDGFEGTAIGCAYVPDSERAVSPTAVRLTLAKLLPSYMLPSKWLVCDPLPKDPKGKSERPPVRGMCDRPA